MTDIMTLPLRQYAGLTDRPVEMKSETHGVDASPDAIGGYYGIGWHEAFRDRRTGELFRVFCSDGVNGGKVSRSDRDLAHAGQCYRAIRKRTTAQAEAGVRVIELSTGEWNIALGHTFSYWLDGVPGEKYSTVGDANRHLDEGQIGTISGIPVVVNPSKRDDLPTYEPPREREVIELGRPSGLTHRMDFSGVEL